MTPRSYCLGKRQVAVDSNRARIIRGARALLKSPGARKGFSVDAVARCAGVTRMTVYHQFLSKAGLLEALYDDLAQRAGLRKRLALAFGERDPRIGLKKLILAFCHFWAGDRLVIRRLHALADLDPDFAQVDRREWRRGAIRELIHRLDGRRRSRPQSSEAVVDALHMLTSFETYDALAHGSRSRVGVTRLLITLAMQALKG